MGPGSERGARSTLKWAESAAPAAVPVSRVPVGEVLVTPQPVQPASHPHRRRTARVARPRGLRGQRRVLLTGTRTERQRTPRHLHGLLEHPEHAHRSPRRTGELQDHRRSHGRSRLHDDPRGCSGDDTSFLTGIRAQPGRAWKQNADGTVQNADNSRRWSHVGSGSSISFTTKQPRDGKGDKIDFLIVG
jgi:hypothetical protein